MAATLIKPTAKPVTAYYAALKAFEAQNISHEQAVRSAFQTLLADLARPRKWTLIPELGSKVRGKGRVIPDATLRDEFHLHRGHWEAKDSADKFDAEIASKINKGYPLENIIFWTPDRAVLYQGKKPKLDLPIRDANSLCDILNAFFSHAPTPIVDFEDAVDEFTARVPELGAKLAEIIAEAHKSNKRFKDAFAAFFDLCKTALNPNISQAAVDEMLVQHLLTERLFRRVFDNPEFLRKNIIASEVEGVIDALSSRSFTREEFLKKLDRFYVAIEHAAAIITEFSDKQHFLNTIYERFFQGYCIKTADTHGVVYTPQPIVDFMCTSVEHVLKEEFDKSLGDDGVIILDPATGTGNFVVNLMRRAAGRGKKYLQRMYREQLFANEIMLLPYYIAAMNIEHEYGAYVGDYAGFEGLCFVDTLELAEAKSQIGLFSERNLERVQRQRRAPITVVIGNPPYNVGQMNHNERNQNRSYPAIDHRVAATYARASEASSVSKLDDPYVKFFRWATDRLNDRDGIVCFVSNNSFVHKTSFDGMRKHLARDFQAVYHIDLEGDVRRHPKLSGTQYNVFGIQLGVGITIAVRRNGSKNRGIRYASVAKDMRRFDKLQWLDAQHSVDRVAWRKLVPDAKNTWLIPPNADQFESFTPIADRSARSGDAGAPRVIFKDYSLGIDTHRDPVVYDFGRDRLLPRVRGFAEAYNSEVDRWNRAPKGAVLDEFVRYEGIVWNRELKNALKRHVYVTFDDKAVRETLYRPFARRHLYMDRILNAYLFNWPRIMPQLGDGQSAENRVLIAAGYERKAFSTFVAGSLTDLNFFADPAQVFSLYLYDEDGSNRRENITDWALKTFREHYSDKKLTKWDIFHYVYAILHHPGYREKFADNLKRELPRIPFAPDFRALARAGEKLAELHLHYDDEKHVKPYALTERWADPKRRDYRVTKMKLSKDKTTLTYNDSLTLEGIPPDALTYRLGNRSALEWVIDQYQVSTDKRSGITSDPNAWRDEHDDEQYILRLVKQVITISLETNRIVRALPAEFSSPPKETPEEPEPAPPAPPKPTGKFKLVSPPPAQPRLPKR